MIALARTAPMSRDDDIKRQKFSLAAHLYSRLRRGGAFSIDAMLMTRDDAYARQVIALAMASPDPKTREYAEQYTALLPAPPKSRPAPVPLASVSSRQPAIPMPASAPPPAVDVEPQAEAPATHRYVRSLR